MHVDQRGWAHNYPFWMVSMGNDPPPDPVPLSGMDRAWSKQSRSVAGEEKEGHGDRSPSSHNVN